MHDNSSLIAFEPRTNEQQRELGERYRKLTTVNARKNFVKEHATRYTQLSRLPYFDLVEQIVIDPMHNLFLGEFSILHRYQLRGVHTSYIGLVKTHFYNIWVQGKILRANHELDMFHEMLADVSVIYMRVSVPNLHSSLYLLRAENYRPILECHLVVLLQQTSGSFSLPSMDQL